MRFTWKLLISTYILVLITLCASSTILIYSMFDNEMQKEITEAENENTMMRMGIHTLVKEYDKSMYGVQVGVLEGVLKRLEVNWKNENRQYAIIDLKGNVISSNRLFAGYGTVREIPKDEQELIYKTYKSGKSYYIQMCTRLNLEEKSILIINTQDITKTYTLREEMLNVSSVITLCMVMVFGAVNIGIVKVLLKPIHEMTEATEKIVQGDLEIRVQEGSKDELGMLARRFNLITEHVQKNIQDLEEYARRQENFVGSFSHELKTPLTSIVNYVDILKDESLDKSEIKDYVTILDNKSTKLKKLVEDLFEMSKMNSGQIILNKSDVDIVELIHQSLGELSFLGENKSLTFKVIGNKDCHLHLDGARISRVMDNLICNAIKYSLENSRIYLEVIECEKECEIIVKNISKYDLDFNEDDILERFVRGDKSRNSTIDGSGLGLAISKTIVELHKGTLKVKCDGDLFKVIIKLPKS
ncbi:MAG TPA: hypothetical protein DCE48_16955 [Lachnospiraceae bacterium]|nr:hypothetical protein [Lachnospiraceae bacterium]